MFGGNDALVGLMTARDKKSIPRDIYYQIQQFHACFITFFVVDSRVKFMEQMNE
jgi:hypothetical protein